MKAVPSKASWNELACLLSCSVSVGHAGADAATSAAQSELDPSDFAAAPSTDQQRASRQVVGCDHGCSVAVAQATPGTVNCEPKNMACPLSMLGFANQCARLVAHDNFRLLPCSDDLRSAGSGGARSISPDDEGGHMEGSSQQEDADTVEPSPQLSEHATAGAEGSCWLLSNNITRWQAAFRRLVDVLLS